MTDRYNALVVTLEQDIREDDAEMIINAIRQLRYVQNVEGNVSNIESHIAFGRARTELRDKLWDVLYPKD